MKPVRMCDLFDKYRDGELDAVRRGSFEMHLASCDECRAKKSLLDQVVYFIKSEEVRPLDLADRIARKAFETSGSWSSAVISWLRPAPALAVLALMIALCSSLWMISSGNGMGNNTYSTFETLIKEADAGDLNAFVSRVHSDNELVLWLEQEGNSQ